MNAARQVLLIDESDAGAPASAALGAALEAQGASVRHLVLGPPYDALLDLLADGWMPVFMGHDSPPDRKADS